MANSLLAEAVDVRRWLKEDTELPFEQRLHRDRAIGRRLALDEAKAAPGKEIARVRAWWQEVRPEAGDGLGDRLVGLVRLGTAVLFTAGVLFGVGVGTLAFAFDGSHPVNLLALLGVLVGVPFCLLVLTLVLLLPGRIPGLSSVRESLAVVNPGRWIGAWLDRYSRLNLYAGFSGGQGSFARWQLVVFSQWLAVGYFFGVLLAGWMLVAVTDLAFGWSTTLDLDAATVHGLFDKLAFPWHAWLPVAAPDLALVEASRFYRLETDPVSQVRAVQLGQWWPFVLMTIICWGLLPRILLLLLGRWRVSAASRSMFCEDPEITALLDRLSVPRVDFGPEEADQVMPVPGQTPAPPETALDQGSGVVLWNDALAEAQARSWLSAHLGTPGGRLLALGVRMKPAEIRAALGQFDPHIGRLIVITKGWEPPLLEFADFLDLLREVLGDSVTITVVPVSTSGDGVDSRDREVWAGFLARRGDSRLYVLQATATAQAEAGS